MSLPVMDRTNMNKKQDILHGLLAKLFDAMDVHEPPHPDFL